LKSPFDLWINQLPKVMLLLKPPTLKLPATDLQSVVYGYAFKNETGIISNAALLPKHWALPFKDWAYLLNDWAYLLNDCATLRTYWALAFKDSAMLRKHWAITLNVWARLPKDWAITFSNHAPLPSVSAPRFNGQTHWLRFLETLRGP
jgi:hypothetical protein